MKSKIKAVWNYFWVFLLWVVVSVFCVLLFLLMVPFVVLLIPMGMLLVGGAIAEEMT